MGKGLRTTVAVMVLTALAAVYFSSANSTDDVTERLLSWLWLFTMLGTVTFWVFAIRRDLRVRRRRRRGARGLCPACGYDMRATPGRCPECGTVATTEAVT